jgi:hypothetical protein
VIVLHPVECRIRYVKSIFRLAGEGMAVEPSQYVSFQEANKVSEFA